VKETQDHIPSSAALPADPFSGDAGRVVLLGLGNILLSDEGVGVHVVNAMKERYAFSPPIDVIDGGTLGLDLLPLFQDRDRILIVDAVDFGQESGTVGTLEDDAISSVLNPKLSAHHIGVADLLFTARLTRTQPPRVCLVGIQPKSLALGLELTPAIRRQTDVLIEQSVQVLTQWGIACRPLSHAPAARQSPSPSRYS
jgi:hydrogenase maturation protease